MKRQACAGLPFEEASQLARFPVLVKHLDLDSFKLRRRLFHLSRIDVYGATDRRLLSLESRVQYRLALMGTYPNWKLTLSTPDCAVAGESGELTNDKFIESVGISSGNVTF